MIEEPCRKSMGNSLSRLAAYVPAVNGVTKHYSLRFVRVTWISSSLQPDSADELQYWETDVLISRGKHGDHVHARWLGSEDQLDPSLWLKICSIVVADWQRVLGGCQSTTIPVTTEQERKRFID